MKMVLIFGIVLISVISANGYLVDMTYPYNNKTLYYPLFFPFTLEHMQRGYIEENEKRIWVEFNKVKTPEHIGTHMDAPSHVNYNEHGWRLDQIPVEHMIGHAVVIDISHRAMRDPDEGLTVEDITKWEERYGRIKDGSIVLVNSGWERHWGNEAVFLGNDKQDSSNYHYPGFTLEAAEWLVTNRNLYGAGTDTLSLDIGSSRGKPAHLQFLPNNIYGLEMVRNLAKIPPSGAKLYVFPIKIEGGSGGACRIVAEFGDKDEMPIYSGGYCVHLSLLSTIIMVLTAFLYN